MMDETINPSVEKSTLGAESICSENVNVENNVEMKGDVLSQEELQNLSSKTLKEIVLLFEKLVETGDIMEMNKHAEYIKATFYKVLKEEKIASGYQVLPGTPDYVEIPEEMDVEEAAEEVVDIQEEAEVAENLQDEIIFDYYKYKGSLIKLKKCREQLLLHNKNYSKEFCENMLRLNFLDLWCQ